jgi:hypothetical protein
MNVDQDPGGTGPGGTGRGSADPTAIREQPSLTTSSGAIWLIVGGLFTAVSLGVLIPMSTLPSGIVAAVAAIVIALLYLGMIVAQLAMPPGRRRLGAHATGMLLIAVIALGAVLFVAAGAWNAGVAVG